MITEQEWAKFGQHVKVGSRFQFRCGSVICEGVLVENYPHAEKESNKNYPEQNIDMLRVLYDDGDRTPILARYEYFQVEGDESWYRFDDILMFEENAS